MIKAVLVGYAVGCTCSGYYLVRLVAGEDIRRRGTGATGATNVGRRLGPLGFAVTFFLDCTKGVAVGWGAAHYGLNAIETSAAILAVVSGHIWPAQLGFRGGKGIATSLGALAAYDGRIVVVIASLFALWFMLSRALVTSGLLAYLLAPLPLIPLGLSAGQLLTVAAVAGMVLVAHREDVRAALEVGREPAAGAGPNSPGSRWPRRRGSSSRSTA
jgi:acyl phosphate:glycerol-3-phosphate acyltransferase